MMRTNTHLAPRDATIHPSTTTDPRVSVQVCGLNAHGQLDPSNYRDVLAFSQLHCDSPDSPMNGEPLFLGWSETVCRYIASDPGARVGLLMRNGLKPNLAGYGHVSIPSTCLEGPREPVTLVYGFGNHNGFMGALDTTGKLYLSAESDTKFSSLQRLACISEDDSPLIAQVVLAGNDRLAVTLLPEPDAQSAHIYEFTDSGAFLNWLKWPQSPQRAQPAKHHVLPGTSKQLTASATTFSCLTDRGEVYTWGDARHRSLGRLTDGEHVSASDAGLVEALGGIKIAKISSGGWMTAALSEDGACYLWGSATPGTEGSLECLRDLETGEVALVEILDAEGEPLDFVDIAVGDGHVVLIAEGGGVFAAGENRNGQLGLGRRSEYVERWQQAKVLGRALSVKAGPRCTALTVIEWM